MKEAGASVSGNGFSSKKWRTISSGAVFAFLFYCLLTIVLTYPLISRISSSFYHTAGADTLAQIWLYWWNKLALITGQNVGHMPLVNSPFGWDLSAVPQSPVDKYFALAVSLVTGEIAAYNILLLLSFPFAGLSMFLLSKRLTGSNRASLIAGLIFGFCPYNLAHAQSHIGLSVGMIWLPLLVLSFINVGAKQNAKNVVLCGLLFALTILTNYYYAYFAVVCLMVFLVYLAVSSWRHRIGMYTFAKKCAAIGAALFIALAISAPFVIPTLSKAAASGSSVIRPYGELTIYSARPWDYLLPGPDSALFGRYTTRFLQSHLHGSNLTESTLFVGYTAILLAAVALFWWLKKRKPGEDNQSQQSGLAYIPLFMLIALVAIIFSAPPKIFVAGLTLRMPSHFAYKILPMFRVYARFGVILQLAVAALAGIGYSIVELGINRKRLLGVVTGLFVVLIVIEFANVPPWYTTDLSKVPREYEWLASKPGNVRIVEYPWEKNTDVGFYNYLFYQRIHKKELVNGAQTGTKQDKVRLDCYDVFDPATQTRLKQLGVRYVFVHMNHYQPFRPKIVKAEGLRLLRVFGSTRIYDLQTDTSKPTVAYNLYEPEIRKDGMVWRWMGNSGDIIITSRFDIAKTMDVRFSVKPLVTGAKRTAQVLYDGKVVYEYDNDRQKGDIQINGLIIKKGANKLTIRTPQPTSVIDATLHNHDGRSVCIAVSELHITLP